MSQLKLGERFFSNRDRLTQVWENITGLAQSADIAIDTGGMDGVHKNDVQPPFLITVVGEVNSGKSSLINCLFNQPLCPVSPLPETNRIIRYQYGKAGQTQQASSGLTAAFQSYPFLREFQIIDTPGANSLDTETRDRIRSLFCGSDVIIVIFPASNPWGPTTWNLISDLEPSAYERMVFIIQQTDKHEDTDIPIILNHLSDLSMQRLGLVPEIVPTSAKHAPMATSDSPPDASQRVKSGIHHLETTIAHLISSATDRARALKRWHAAAIAALSEIELKISELRKLHIKQNDFLGSLENEIDNMRESLVSRLPRHLKKVAEVFETEAFQVTRQLKKWLGISRSIRNVFVGDQTGARIESLFISRLRTTLEAVAESDADDVVVACLNHWQELGIRVRMEISPSIDQSIPIRDSLEQARQRFMQRIGGTAHQAIGSLHVRKDLERELRTRLIALKSFTASSLIFLSLGAIAGIFEIKLLPWVLCSISGLFMGVGVIIAMVTGSRISHDFKLSLLNTCGQFADTLRDDYEDALRLFFQEYASCLGAIRAHLAREKQSIDPMTELRQNLLGELKAIGDSL